MGKILFKKEILNGEFTGFYSPITLDFRKKNIIAHFLIDSYDEKFKKKWLGIDKFIFGGSEMVKLEKRGESIILSDAYDNDINKFEFSISRQTFSKILDEWNQARNAAKKFIVIEVSDDNDVHIYPMDHVEISPEERAEQDRIREEMWGKIESKGIFKNFFDGASSEEKEREKIYNLVIEGSSGPIVRNMFPSEWTREHVMEKIVEAFEYAKKEEAPLRPIDNQRFSVVGQTKEKVIIRMVLDKDANMLTAYPELL